MKLDQCLDQGLKEDEEMGFVGMWPFRIVCWIKREHDFIHYPEWPNHWCCFRCGLDKEVTREEVTSLSDSSDE